MMKTLEISGFGGGYEGTCQTMLTRGLKWASEHDFNGLEYQGYEGVYGFLKAKTEAAKDLDRALFADRIDATGAMHQTVVNHLLFILHEDYATWLNQGGLAREIEIDDPERGAALLKLAESGVALVR
jgi:hypothetical protein